MNEHSTQYSKKLFLFLWLCCILGSWSIFPYLYYVGVIPQSTSLLNVFLLGTLQAAVFFGLACYLSYKILPKTDLNPFAVNNIWRQILLPGVVSGVFVGLIILFLDKTFFQSPLSKIHAPFWAGTIASIYGAVNEEVLLRLCLFTLIYFIFRKLFDVSAKSRLLVLWIVNIIVAIAFGLGHLPAAFQLSTAPSSEIFRILLLNAIPGLVFGWLYWSRGLWTAMLAHFVTDIMIHVLFI